MTRIAAIVFDLDDTLYPERDFAFSGFDAAGAWAAAEVGIDGLGAAGLAARAKALFLAGSHRQIFDRALFQMGITDCRLVARLVQVYRDHSPRIALAPDAAAFLARDRRPRALVTDGPPATQANKIAALGLAELGVAPMIRTGAWGPGHDKPHPRGFLAVEAALGLGGGELVYVADNRAKDFVTPRRRGWRTVQVARPGAIHAGRDGVPAEAWIDSLDGLDGTLDRLEREAVGLLSCA